MDAVRGYSMNALLAMTMSSQQDTQATRLAQLDASVRTEALRKSSAAGAGATTTTDIKYETGPDGKLYAVGGSVTTSKRFSGTADEVRDVRSGAIDPSQINSKNGVDPANDNSNIARAAPTFADLAAPEINLSPFEFAKLQEEQQYDDSAKQQFLSKLQATDVGVRTHEAQHFSVGAGLTQGTPEYDYVKGPDGNFYAVGGQVNLGTTGSSDPEIAAREADTLARAATAPADTSAQDISVARSSGADAASLYSKAVYANNAPVIDMVG